MFIEELTENQIKSFLEQEYPPEEGWSYSWYLFNDKNEPNYRCSLQREKDDLSKNIRLEDFYSDGVSSKAWKRYLYEIFGEKYKQAYVEECLKVLD